MPVRSLNHFTVMSRDLARTRDFYCDVLGMEEGPRPEMAFAGMWLYASGRPLLHVIAVGEAKTARDNVIDHVAFDGTDADTLIALMDAKGVKYRLNRMADGGSQLFCRDPDGALIEIDFDAGERDRRT